MADAVELMLADISARFAGTPASEAFARLYTDDELYGHVFANLHERLNQHFEAINGRLRSTKHYWAEDSRSMLALFDDLKETLDTLNAAGIEVSFADEYAEAITRCGPRLSMSGGSTVPDDFRQIRIIKYRPIFLRPEISVKLVRGSEAVQLKMVGEGSYAVVYSYIDPDYGIRFAVKRAKKGLGERDLRRFRQEFDVLKRLSFPYIVEVYQYDESRNEYRMEFCDETLRDYISRRNNKLSFASRKRIALQVLYGINYIHHEGYLHRDVSLQNVLSIRCLAAARC